MSDFEYKSQRHGDEHLVLVKLEFRLRGRRLFGRLEVAHPSPGFCALEISAGCDESVFAKWDETPNPVVNDEYRPELAPQTYYQPLFLERTYLVPILAVHVRDDALNTSDAAITVGDVTGVEIFSSKWFERFDPYQTQREDRWRIGSIENELTLHLVGNGVAWNPPSWTIKRILEEAFRNEIGPSDITARARRRGR